MTQEELDKLAGVIGGNSQRRKLYHTINQMGKIVFSDAQS